MLLLALFATGARFALGPGDWCCGDRAEPTAHATMSHEAMSHEAMSHHASHEDAPAPLPSECPHGSPCCAGPVVPATIDPGTLVQLPVLVPSARTARVAVPASIGPFLAAFRVRSHQLPPPTAPPHLA